MAGSMKNGAFQATKFLVLEKSMGNSMEKSCALKRCSLDDFRHHPNKSRDGQESIGKKNPSKAPHSLVLS